MEDLLVVLGFVLGFAFLVVPIWMLVLLHGIRSRLQEQEWRRAEDMRRILDVFEQLRPGTEESAAPAETPAGASPAPASMKPIPAAPPPVPVAAPGPTGTQPPPLAPQAETEWCTTEADEELAVASPPPPTPAIRVPLPTPAPQPEAVDSAARRALRAAWNWLIVGSEYRRPGVSMEEAVATNWLIRIGVLVLVVGIGFFLKYSIDKGLLGPRARVAMCFLGGAILIVSGVRLFGRRYHILGQGLVGAGLATLYFAVFAATGLFHLLPIPAGFVLMGFVTLAAGVLAVRYHTVLLAVLGTLGGYLTPVMLASPERNDVWLFGYLLLLALGVAGVAWRKRWPALTYLSFVCHNLIFFQAVNWVPRGVDFATTMPFFAAYFMVFTTAIVLPCVTGGKAASALEPIGLFLTAGVFFYGGYELVRFSFSKASVAWVTIAMAAYYTGHVYFFLRRAASNRVFLATFLGLAAGSLALTLPLLLSKAWLTMSWSVLALVAMWVALRLQSSFLRGLALTLQVFVVLKLGVLDFEFAYGLPLPASLRDYWPVLLDRAMQFGVPTVSFWLSSRLLARLPPAKEQTAPPHGGAWGIVCLIAMYAMLFLLLNLECHRLCVLVWLPCQAAVLTLIWVGFGLHLLARRERLGDGLCAWFSVLALLALIIKVFVDFNGWEPELERLVYTAHYQNAGGLLRQLDVGFVIVYLALAWHVWRRRDTVRAAAVLCGYTALAILFLHLTFETATFFDQYLPGFRGGSVSMFWALYAFALIIGGIRWQVRTLRYLGLGLFCVVVAKVFLVDLSRLASVYRIAAFVALGIVLLLAAFVYLRQSQQEDMSGTGKGETP